MRDYVLRIAGAVLISAVMSLIVPNGKMGKLIQGMGQLFVVLILVSPVVSFLSGGSFSFRYDDLTNDDSFIQASTELAQERDAETIETFLRETFDIQTEVIVCRIADGSYRLEKIVVEIIDFGINKKEEHIDITTQVQSRLQQEYGCDVEVFS